MDSKQMWTFMIQLGNNMWDKKNRQTSYIKDEEESIYRDYLYLDKPLWNEITAFLPSCGFNTILIDIGEGIRLDSHPELAVEGSWTKEEMRAELTRLRSLGLEPIPKYNFSSGHSAWLQDYAYMVGTPTYDRVCKDIIEEVIELFDTPAYFHLGLEEEDYANQRSQPVAVVRSPAKKIRDANYLFDICRSHGVRPWIWCNFACVEGYGGDDAFLASIPKDVLISNWYYGHFPSQPESRAAHKSISLYQKLGEWGYDQIPTSSTYGSHLSTKETMKYFKAEVNMDTTVGFMTVPWLPTMPKYKYALLNDAFVFGREKEAIFPNEQ